jgi:hypothetical protein
LSPICLWSVQVSLGPTNSYITGNPLARGLFIAMTIEAVHTSETSVYYNETTRGNIRQGSNLNTRRRENLKSNILSLSSGLIMEAVHTSETSLYYETTWRNIPQGSNLNTRRRENLKSNVLALSSGLMMEAVHTSETSVNI